MNKSTIFWIVGGIGTAVGGYFLYKRITRPTETFGPTDEIKPNDDSNPIDDPNPNQGGSTVSDDDLPLKRGSKGEKVKQLQRFLVADGYNIGTFGANRDGVDGNFGRMTESAVIQNQQPFATFKSMYPSAVEGQVSADFFNLNIRGSY